MDVLVFADKEEDELHAGLADDDRRIDFWSIFGNFRLAQERGQSMLCPHRNRRGGIA